MIAGMARQPCQYVRIGLAESERNAERGIAVAEGMATDGLSRRSHGEGW